VLSKVGYTGCHAVIATDKFVYGMIQKHNKARITYFEWGKPTWICVVNVGDQMLLDRIERSIEGCEVLYPSWCKSQS
jgi:hypothetical protein